MTKLFRALAVVLGLGMAVASTPTLAGDDAALEAAKKDMAATLGPNAVELKVLPDNLFAPTWAQARSIWADQKGVIPPKYRALIGLAVSSQIPCQYCIYADTSDARVFGASDEEIKEAIMHGAMTREWSTILNGNMVDLSAFKKEIDEGAAATREAMKKQATTQ